ncbi:MAG: phosphotransferase family protein [Acidimicrobiia bacterium]|nr:phosphotransferase family protein [Acidimicrobiia bacterium]
MIADTAPIRAEEAFDEAKVAAFLRERLPDLVGDHHITFDQFPGGAANLTYRAVAGDTELVLRRAPLGKVAKGGHDMEREHRVLAQLWRGYPLAPRAYAYCADPEVMGKPFFVMERRHGFVVRSRWPEPLDGKAQQEAVAQSLVTALADLHLVEPQAVGLAELGRPDGFVARQVAGWRSRWAAAKTRDVATMSVVGERLSDSIPEPHGVSILHNDFKLDNTMVAEDGTLTAVFDWDMATLGDPLVDVGTLLAYWADSDGPTYQVFGGRVVPLTEHLGKAEVIERYAAHSGFDVDRISFYEALAYFRIAVILEQIYARYVSGQTTDPRFALFGDAAPILADAALEALTG